MISPSLIFPLSLFTFLFLYISPLFLSSSHISLSLKSFLYTCLSYFSYISIFLSYFASQSLLSPLLLHLLSYIFFLLYRISFSYISSLYLISHLFLLYPFTLTPHLFLSYFPSFCHISCLFTYVKYLFSFSYIFSLSLISLLFLLYLFSFF